MNRTDVIFLGRIIVDVVDFLLSNWLCLFVDAGCRLLLLLFDVAMSVRWEWE